MKKILETLKSKWAEYLLEIIVIMIGILGAYSLNEWNNSLREKKLLNYYVSSLIQDLKEQSAIINAQIEYENNVMSNTDYLLKVISGSSYENQLDTIHSLLKNLRGRRTFHSIQVTYNDMINSGNLNLINNQDRRNTINYYESLNRLSQVINANNNTVIDPLSVEISTFPYVSANPKNIVILSQKLNDFVSRVKLENIIETRSNVSQVHIRQLTFISDETNHLISTLEK